MSTTDPPNITLFFLGASRAIRIAWLLEELALPYELVSSPRAPSGLAPPEFKRLIPTSLGKSPVIKDGDVVVQESSAIAEYLCETYDTEGKLLPRERHARAKVREWMAAAEGTFMIHALAILYARWKIPATASSALPEMESGLAINVQNDLDWLESELSSSASSAASGTEIQYLVGNDVTAADILMGFSVDFIFARNLGTETESADSDQQPTKPKKEWPNVRRWLAGVQSRDGYRKAVAKTGYAL